jgi:hypothetical protein
MFCNHSILLSFQFRSITIPFSSRYHTILHFLTIYIHSITIPYKLVDCCLSIWKIVFFLNIFCYTIPSPFCLRSIIIFNLFPFCRHSVIIQSPFCLRSVTIPFYCHSNSIPFSSRYHTILHFLTIYIHSITIPYKLADCCLSIWKSFFFLNIFCYTIPSPFCLHSIIIFNLFPFCHNSIIIQSPLHLHSIIIPFYYHSNSIPLAFHFHPVTIPFFIFLPSIFIPLPFHMNWLIVVYPFGKLSFF